MATVTRQTVETYVRSGKLEELFREYLGWDPDHGRPLPISVPVTTGDDAETRTYRLQPIAEKRGVRIFACEPEPDGTVPPDPRRRRIERELTKVAHEHLIIFHDDQWANQVWQWPSREPGRPLRLREIKITPGRTSEELAQALAGITFTLAEEDELTLTDVTERMRTTIDKDRVTKRFYERFSKERTAFESFVTGIQNQADRALYASLMLNRLMFVYFIQQKGFLDGDTQYLQRRLAKVQASADTPGTFLTFYRAFLRRLFHDGLNRPTRERDRELTSLIGKVPYLNGGLFDVQDVEANDEVDIPDEAFARLLDFFGEYQWHLDDRPLASGSEINPDVLGYIFEKFVNQKETGAYYTKEDITGYICQNTIIPYILDAARKECAIAFRPDEAGSVWRLLQDDPDRYLYPAVRHGVIDSAGHVNPLPAEIAAGVDDVSQRGGWNRRADSTFYDVKQTQPYGLPTETWREYVHRRQRCLELRETLRAGGVHTVDDLVTWNLDIRQFAQDAVERCEGPELLRALYKAIRDVTVLDPTCGSGAFLFAALNVLEPLHAGCLERMRGFLDDLDREPGHRPEKYRDFRNAIEETDSHPNQQYFVLRRIVLNNLYGVDIEPGAVEICKLRLFLKLVARLDDANDIEPLPDIDFNIRAGNTLVGFTNREDVGRAMVTSRGQMRLPTDDDQRALARIDEQADQADRAFRQFKRIQARERDSADLRQAKADLRGRLDALSAELDVYLAGLYGVNPEWKKPVADWKQSHQPFHWFADFYGIMQGNGGFDVVVGNPPYVEYRTVRDEYTLRGYQLESCGNLYAMVMERSLKIQRSNGRMGMIVQLPIVCTDRMEPLQSFLDKTAQTIWYSNFDDRPGKLFDGLEHIRATIALTCLHSTLDSGKCAITLSTRYHRWPTEFRERLFPSIRYTQLTAWDYAGAVPKAGQKQDIALLNQLKDWRETGAFIEGKEEVYYHNAPQYWVRCIDFLPYFFSEGRRADRSAQLKSLRFESLTKAKAMAATLNSSLFYWWFILWSDCRHLNMREIERFPIGLDVMSVAHQHELARICERLMEDYRRYARRKDTVYRASGRVSYDEFNPRMSKPIIDEIDAVLAEHYGFSAEELDFIQNFDIKYRAGAGD